MRISVPAGLLLLFTVGCMPMPGGTAEPGPQQGFGPPPGDRPRGDRLFISPMGEPFRGNRQNRPEAQWFAGADANSDGSISVSEMQTDAARFFRTLDTNHDGEIAPDEMERYELSLVPETRVPDSTATAPGAPGADKPSRPRTRGVGARQGAGRFGYLDLPQPVIAADANFNRGVSSQEFVRAAELRLGALDRNGDGKLERGELPRTAGGSGPPGRSSGRRMAKPGTQ